MPIVINPIKREDIPGAVECIQQAFKGDPYSEWVFDQKNFNVSRNQSSLTLRCEWGIANAYFVVAKDTSSTDPDQVIGVAMWLPPAPISATESWTAWYHNWRLWFRQGLLNVWYLGHGGLNTKRYWIWKREQAKIQEKLWIDPRGYWFCNIVTVLPQAQGKGIGKLLFEDVTRKADAEGTRCYLESSRKEPNVKIYERLGFELKGTMKVEDEGDACDLYCMVRDPQNR